MAENNRQPSANTKYYSTKNRASSYSLLEENALLEEWVNTYSYFEKNRFCGDGLLSARNGNAPEKVNEEINKWKLAQCRVLFLCLYPGMSNEEKDARSWFADENKLNNFGLVILNWLCMLNEKFKCPTNQFTFMQNEKDCFQAAKEYPMALVNICKLTNSKHTEICLCNKRKLLLKRHIRDILQPTIIVNCGGKQNGLNNYLFDIIKEIYDDGFGPQNQHCFFNKLHNVHVVDSYYNPGYAQHGGLKNIIKKMQDIISKIRQL